MIAPDNAVSMVIKICCQSNTSKCVEKAAGTLAQQSPSDTDCSRRSAILRVTSLDVTIIARERSYKTTHSGAVKLVKRDAAIFNP